MNKPLWEKLIIVGIALFLLLTLTGTFLPYIISSSVLPLLLIVFIMITLSIGAISFTIMGVKRLTAPPKIKRKKSKLIYGNRGVKGDTR